MLNQFHRNHYVVKLAKSIDFIKGLKTIFPLQFLKKCYIYESKLDMSAQQNETIAKAWFEAFNEHDLEKLLSLYHNEAKHYSPKLKIRKPETNGLVVGKDALRAWWKDAFERLPSLHYEVTNLTANKTRIFMEYVRKVENEEDMMVAELLEIQSGMIVFSKVYHG